MPSIQHKILTKTAEAPSELLDKAVSATKSLEDASAKSKMLKKTKDYWLMLGPGLTTGASDDDPSGIATYSQAGAKYGFGLLWLSVWTYPLMGTVQEMCARIGLATGRGLAGNIRIFFSKHVLYICAALLFGANAFNIGADLGAMAKATQLLIPGAGFTTLVIGFALFSLGLQIFTPYIKYAKYLKWLALILFSYIISAMLADIDWGQALKAAIIPHIEFTKEQIILICAILGTTISPYLFFWQTSQEVEEAVQHGQVTVKERKHTDVQSVKRMRFDVWTGMLLSNVVMFFIIAAAGGVLYPHGITEITSASQAAEALRPFAGNATYFLFAIGIIGTGLLAIPVLAASSSYAVAESVRWKEGLNRDLGQAKAFYGIIIFSMIVGLAMNFIGLDPIKALIYAAVANALVAPVIIFFIVRIASSKKFMGAWANKRISTIVGWTVFALMLTSGGAAIFALF